LSVEARAESLQEMVDGEGWGYVKEYIEARITDHKAQLMTCQIEDVTKHRAKVESLNSVLLFVQDAIEEGKGGQV